jgi:DNA (cytosine-5)-methyltransferase 1
MSQPNDTDSRRKIWKQKSKIVDENGVLSEKTQTITTKQDRHPNSGNIYFDYDFNKKSKFRFLTPRECFLLMGFDEKDFDVLIQNNFAMPNKSLFFSRDVLFKLAGNSIVVDVLEQVFNQMLELDEILKNS